MTASKKKPKGPAKPRKSRAKPGAKKGRPKAVSETLATAELVEGMRQIGCTVNEIADLLGVERHYISRNFAPSLSKGRAGLKVNLRRSQVSKAMAGDGAMLKWLGIQYLKQANKIVLEGDDQMPMQFDPENLAAMRKAGLIFHTRQEEQAAEAARKDAELIGED